MLELEAGQIKPAPEFNGAAAASCITGLGTVRQGEFEHMLILIDIEGLMRSPEMGPSDTTYAH